MIQVMGILNATPDSFSDGGLIDNADALRTQIQSMISAGVDILDVGGESTRPGATPVPADVEIARVRPVIRAIKALDDQVTISIDTSKAEVADAALRAGAHMVNDVSGLSDPGMAFVVKHHDCPIVLMRNKDLEGDVVQAAKSELEAILQHATDAGISLERIILDPGLGFGERPGAHVEDNMALIQGISEYSLGRPVLIGASRKRFIGTMMGEKDPARRVAGSVDVARQAMLAGAAVVRVHDVAETIRVLRQ